MNQSSPFELICLRERELSMTNDDAGRKRFNFFVDDKQYQVEHQTITGAQIRSIAGVDSSYQLFLEEHGHDDPDRKVELTDVIDLAVPGVEKFYTVPPATFGASQ
jgi:Multiubiquitin